jgi:hypothetical protein
MQKRIFRLGGKPFMVTRDGGFWETHGTFLRSIEDHARDEPRSSEALGGLPKPEHAPSGDTTPSLPVREAATVSSRDADGPEGIARTQVRPPRRRRTGAEVSPSREGDGAPSGSVETGRVEHARVAVEAPDEVPTKAGDQPGMTRLTGSLSIVIHCRIPRHHFRICAGPHQTHPGQAQVQGQPEPWRRASLTSRHR